MIGDKARLMLVSPWPHLAPLWMGSFFARCGWIGLVEVVAYILMACGFGLWLVLALRTKYPSDSKQLPTSQPTKSLQVKLPLNPPKPRRICVRGQCASCNHIWQVLSYTRYFYNRCPKCSHSVVRFSQGLRLLK